ncbi:MAG TPA: NUDIX hydrolase [Oscillospiraceae bacterium]|nr:NUDIX hydrolase [Oscillospiraceae bacterium]HPS35960.1 NUDIX hydrolase [Oscillospiraceae bacterium]
MENKADCRYEPWFAWAVELQALAQNGLAYTENKFDKERFERIREIAAEMVACKADMPKETVEGLFCGEKGYQTPKLDTRAAIFKENKILLVKEDGRWSLPGGWVDVTESVFSNTVKEAKEEAGVDVRPIRVIALQDRNKHNIPRYIYSICKVFVLCELLGGKFESNTETDASGFFTLDSLPELFTEKNTYDQIKMCFEATASEHWETRFD